MPVPRRNGIARFLFSAGRRWFSDVRIPLDSPAVVFAPHPDDEVLGCGGTIALKLRAGAAVHVVIMTDGRTSHANLVDAATLIRMRRLEAMDASIQLGLTPSDYTFLDFEDGRLRANADQARQRVAKVLREFRPQQVFVPHRRDRLPDHEATFEAVASAVREHDEPVTLLEYPVWLWNTWPWSDAFPSARAILRESPRLFSNSARLAFGCRTRIDIHAVLDRKLNALQQYRSQLQRHGGDPRWAVLSDVSNGSFLECFRSGVEVFRRTEHPG